MATDRSGTPSQKTEVQPRGWTSIFWALLVVTTSARLLYAAWLPLTGDEAYFWEWARHPALCYYDHPPLAGWLLTATRALLGDTVVAVRLPAVLFGAVILIAIRAFAERISSSSEAAAKTAILAMGVPILAVGGVIFSTDTPLLLAGGVGGLLLHRALQMGSLASWVGLGACLAVVSLSKFLGFALFAGCLACLVLLPRYRALLRTPGPWIAVGMGVLGFVPVLLWNARNDWATFIFNFASRHSAPSLGLSHLADYVLGQAVALGPVLLLASSAVMLRSLRPSPFPGPEEIRIPSLLALVPLGGFLVLSLTTKVGLHWPAIGVPALAVATGTFLLAGTGRTRLYWTTVGSSWAVAIAIFALPLVAPLLPEGLAYPLRPEKISSSQLKKALHSPQVVGQTVAEALRHAREGGEAFVFTKSYALSSLVAFYTPGHPETTVLGAGSAHGRNHYLWFDPEAHRGQNAVFVTYDPLAEEMDILEARFERVEAWKGSDETQRVTVAVCYGFNGVR